MIYAPRYALLAVYCVWPVLPCCSHASIEQQGVIKNTTAAIGNVTRGDVLDKRYQLEDISTYSSHFFNSKKCHIRSTDRYMHNKINQMIENKVKLINYQLFFKNYTTNPLLENSTWSYRADTWARVSSQHGQTLLSLAFNYGILSMMTLTFGVETMMIELEDLPYKCMQQLSERDKIDTVMYLLMRDFKEEDASDEVIHDDGVIKTADDIIITLVDDERVCHEIIKNESNYAKFTDRCCHVDRITEQQLCTTDIRNVWLSILYGLLACIKFSILFFGPLMFIPMIETIAKEEVPYVVKLKESLFKTILPVKPDTLLGE